MRWLLRLFARPVQPDRDLARALAQVDQLERARARERRQAARRAQRARADAVAPFLGVSKRRSRAAVRRTTRRAS